jgi:hypothetical protein
MDKSNTIPPKFQNKIKWDFMFMKNMAFRFFMDFPGYACSMFDAVFNKQSFSHSKLPPVTLNSDYQMMTMFVEYCKTYKIPTPMADRFSFLHCFLCLIEPGTTKSTALELFKNNIPASTHETLDRLLSKFSQTPMGRNDAYNLMQSYVPVFIVDIANAVIN